MSPVATAQDTRREILKAAFAEVYMHGYNNTGLNQIIERTSVTKGAMYHHFSSKKELGLAIINEIIRPAHEKDWIEPVRQSDDPLNALQELIQARLDQLHVSPDGNCGCPINNLVQELAQDDEDFRAPLADILSDWILSIKEALEQGKSRGVVAEHVECEQAASFIVTCLEGAPCLVKTDPSLYWVSRCVEGLFTYFESLRPLSS